MYPTDEPPMSHPARREWQAQKNTEHRRVMDEVDRSTRGNEVTIDTSTTAGKIAVMQHASDHGFNTIECLYKKYVGEAKWGPRSLDHEWNWDAFDYRITPTKTALQRAREQVARDNLGEADSLEALVGEVDAAPAVMISTQHPTIGTNYPWICEWTSGRITAGRYRLLRDDS